MHKIFLLAGALSVLAGPVLAATPDQIYANRPGEKLSAVPYEPQLPYVKEGTSTAAAPSTKSSSPAMKSISPRADTATHRG